MSAKDGCPTGVLAARMSSAWGTGGGLLTLHAGLLIDTGAVMPSSSEVVMEVSASLTEHAGPAVDLVQWQREIMGEASLNQPGSSERGLP